MDINKRIHQQLEKKLWKRIFELEERNKNLNRLIQGSILIEMAKKLNKNNFGKKIKEFKIICCNCKKIKDEKGYWNLIEAFIENHYNVKLSHGICPECSDKLYGKENWYIDLKKRKNL